MVTTLLSNRISPSPEAIAAELGQKGLIKRGVNAMDRRKKVITFTDDGTNLFFSAETEAIETRQTFFSKLTSKEQRTIMTLLRKIALTISPYIKAQLIANWE